MLTSKVFFVLSLSSSGGYIMSGLQSELHPATLLSYPSTERDVLVGSWLFCIQHLPCTVSFGALSKVARRFERNDLYLKFVLILAYMPSGGGCHSPRSMCYSWKENIIWYCMQINHREPSPKRKSLRVRIANQKSCWHFRVLLMLK